MSVNNSNPLKPNNSTSLKKKLTKSTHVPTACLNCKKAHLACDLSRPCKRCVSLDKSSTCIDIKHKKRGRPKLSEKRWFSGVGEKNGIVTSPPLAEINSASARSSLPLTTTLLTTYSRTSPSLSPPAFAHLLPLTTPLLPTSSFEITQKQNDRKSDFYPTKMLTIFLSMDLCCARVSDESVDILGCRPDTIGHCSFYDLIQSDSMNTLSHIHRRLLDNCHSGIQQKHPISFSTTANSDLFQKMSPLQLFSIANGSQTFKEKLNFKNNNKEVPLDCKFYLGGGFGADLSKDATLESLYIVCIASSSAHQPAPSLSEFTTPSTINTSPILNTVSTSSTATTSPITTPTASSVQSNLSTSNTDIMSFVSSSAVDSLLAHDQLEANLYPVTNSPNFLTTYNSPNGFQEKDAMDLVNHLYCSAVTPAASEIKNDTSLKSCLYSSPMSDTYSDDSITDINAIINENSLIMLSKTPPRIKLGSLSDNLW